MKLPTPYRLLTPRLELRALGPSDAEVLGELIRGSLDHLRPWVTWASAEPQTLDERVEHLRRVRARFDSDQAYTFGVRWRPTGRLAGCVSLAPREARSGMELGYWLAAGEQGSGVATEAGAALVRVAFSLFGADHVAARCDALNSRSVAVAQRLGFTLQARVSSGSGPTQGLLFELGRRDLSRQDPGERLLLSAWDAADRPIALRAPDVAGC